MKSNIVELATIRPKRVCIIKPSSLGDVVHATPVLAALRARWPWARISWVVHSGLRGLVDGLAELDEVIPFDRAKMGFGPRGAWRLARTLAELRSKRFDVAIDLQGLLRSAILTAATGARVRVGLADAREGAARLYTHKIVAPAGVTHAVDRLLHFAAAFGCEPSPARFLAPISASDREWSRAVLERVARPVVVLNMGARWLTKRWPPAGFAAVARKAQETLGAGIVLVGAPDDRPLIAEFESARGDRDFLDLCGTTTLPRLAALAAEADVFVSNDTGPLHLAVAAGARVVGIYTCTSPDLTGPYAADAIVVRTEVPCAASRIKVCERLDCMRELTPERVWRAVKSQIEATRRAAG